MPIKPPIVWHLDAHSIKEKSNSKDLDRLTQIKFAWIEFEEGKKTLDETLEQIDRICKTNGAEEGSSTQS